MKNTRIRNFLVKRLLIQTVKKRGVEISLALSLMILLAAFAYEQLSGNQPCPLCWLQRGVFVGLAVFALLSLVLRKVNWGRWLAIAGFGTLAAVGVGIAARHMYIKLNPASASCGLDVETLLSFFPLKKALMQMLAGSADCAQAANLLYLPLPIYSFVGYLLVAGIACYSLFTMKTAK